MFGWSAFGENAFCENTVALPARGGRPMTLAAAIAAGKEMLSGCLLFEAEFDSGTVRFTNGVVDIVWGDRTFLAVGSFAGVSTMEEPSDLQSTGIQVTLSGIPVEMMSLALGEQMQRRRATVYVALLDDDDRLIPDPIILFRGRIDAPVINLGQTASVVVAIESPLSDWERPRVRRYTDEDQQAKYPGDRFFEFVPAMVNKPIVWGRG